MDACTKIWINYFAINIHWFGEDGKVKTNFVSYRSEKRTCKFLRKLASSVLKDLEIEMKQIVRVITNNAWNMISTIKMLKEVNEDFEFWYIQKTSIKV